MTAGRDINSYLSSLPENTVSLQLSLKYTHCVKSPSKSDPLLLRVVLYCWNESQRSAIELGTMSSTSLQIHTADYVHLVVLVKLKIITVRPLSSCSWVVSQDDFLYMSTSRLTAIVQCRQSTTLRHTLLRREPQNTLWSSELLASASLL